MRNILFTLLIFNFFIQGEKKLYSQDKWDFRNETIYLLITDRFVDGDKSNNNIYGDEYKPGNLRYYQGGDFKGLIENLDYIKDMGFSAIWITPPVMQPPGRYMNSSGSYDASGYHGYWAWDFSKIDPHLESKGATYKDLIEKAHLKGIKIIQDIVANHAHGGDTHISVSWHDKRGKVYGLGRTYDYFDDKENWFNHKGPVIADLLDFNDENPAVLDWFSEIYKKYQDMGVDAFRLDTVVWMRDGFWRDFTERLHKNKKDFFIFGEVWTNNDFDLLSKYTKLSEGDMMNSAMSVLDMPLSSMGTWGRMEEVFKGGDYRKADEIFLNDNKYKDATYLVTFLDNHDKPRFNGNSKEGSPAELNNYFDALNFYFTVRGIPCIYYGTEIGMSGGNDPDNRKYLGLQGIKEAKKNPIYWHIKKLNALRRSNIALQKGVQELIYSSKDQYVFKRKYGEEEVFVLLNKSDKESSVLLDLKAGNYRDIYSGQFIGSGGKKSININAHGIVVITAGAINGKPWDIKIPNRNQNSMPDISINKNH